MGFFLVGRSREDGSLSLISTQEFDTRAAAVDQLSSLEVDASLESEVYVSNLEQATPVLLVQRGSAAEAPAEPLDAPQEAEAPPLADALRQATGTLESEGIVAPDSIGPAEEAAPESPPAPGEDGWPWDSASGEETPAAADTPSETPAEEPAAEPAVEPEAELAVEPEPAPEPEVAPEPEAPPAYVPDPLEEPAVDDNGALVYAKGDDDTVEMSRTVVMGAYSEDSPIPEAGAAPTVEPEVADAVPEPVVVDAVAEEIPPAPEPPAAAEIPTPQDPAVESLIADLEILPDEPEAPVMTSTEATSFDAPVAPPAEAPEYQASDVDLTSLTCDDCVYVNTCPNKDERDPASCGSFQWKSS